MPKINGISLAILNFFCVEQITITKNATRPHKSGKLYLYVLTEENKVEKILSDFTKLDQEYVYLRKTAMGGYQVGLEPFVVTQSTVTEELTNQSEVETKETQNKPKKRTYTKKKKNETERD